MVRIKDTRLKQYNYSTDGYYFVTIVANYRENLLSDRKSFFETEIQDLTALTPGLRVDYFVIMPNHIHMILILENCEFKLGEIIRRFKAKTSKFSKIKLWQPNYYEHVIRNDKALEKIIEYIIYNPESQILKFEQFYN
jgi:REP element-mobilizing transposase RayT